MKIIIMFLNRANFNTTKMSFSSLHVISFTSTLRWLGFSIFCFC